MNFVKIDESITQAQVALAQAVAQISEGEVSSDDVWMKILSPVYLMRDEARPILRIPESILDASNAVADWSKGNYKSAVSYADSYINQLRSCRQFLELAQHERISRGEGGNEEVRALKEFNQAIKTAYLSAIIVKRFAEAECAARHPPIHSYFSFAIDEINQKLDTIISLLEKK